MSDLRPYICTYADCPTAEQSYDSRSSFLNHEHLHELDKMIRDSEGLGLPPKLIEKACLFCGEIQLGNSNERAQHVGRHMEEIAFSVVTKPYEDWDFYTESSGKSRMGVNQFYQATSDSNHPSLVLSTIQLLTITAISPE